MERKIKRIIAFILAMIMAIFIELPSGIFNTFSPIVSVNATTVTQPSGDGTTSSPYLIATAENWEWLAQKVNSGAKATVNAKLTANINMGGATITKVGLNEKNTFTGLIDGGNFKISNFVVNADGNTYDNGLFGYVENATIKNLEVSSILKLNANSSSVGNNNHAYSGFVAHLTGSSALIENCNVNTTINIATSGNYNRVGVIASNIENGAIVRNCQSSGTIKNTATKYNLVNCGGIVGRVAGGTVENCESNVSFNNTINRTDDTDISIYNIGGIVGLSDGTNTITNCNSKGNMTFDATDTEINQIGGIVGYVDSSSKLNIDKCTNSGSITITSRRSSRTNNVTSIGGIIGGTYNKNSVISNITGCQNNGAVTVKGDSSSIPSGKEVNAKYIGGIAGQAGGTATFVGCLNTGNVTLTDIIPDQHAGVVGYSGYNSGLKIESCGNTGAITCQTKLITPNAGNNCTAGILGYINNNSAGSFKGVNNCFNTGTITSYLNLKASVIGQIKGSLTLSTDCKNYYLEQSGVNPIGSKPDNFNITSVAKTSAQFASGEVTYLINNGVIDGTQYWYQTIGTDTTPKLSGKIVKKESDTYKNVNDCKHSSYTNGICSICGEAYEEPKLVDGVYQIANYGNLVWFQQYVDQGGDNLKANAILTKDITANENLISNGTYVKANVKYKWRPIARTDQFYRNPYSGTIDGNNHTISGLYSNMPFERIALIGYFSGTVKNLYIKDSYFEGYSNTATFVASGKYEAIIENCGSNAVIKGSNYCGGIAGATEGKITNCYFAGKITVNNNSGAITSDYYNRGRLTNCYYLDGCGLTSTRATSATTAQFASGEVTYKLNNGVTDGTQIWYQTIGTDTLPKFNGKIVYCNYNSTTSSIEYSNTDAKVSCPHSEYEKGICKACGEAYEEPKLVDGVYQITNYGNLVWFQQYVDQGGDNLNANAILTNDIVANENLISGDTYVEENVKYEWTPIARNNSIYRGTFDGNRHTISGLYVNDGKYYGAFIGRFYGTIKNLYITDSYFGGSYYTGTFVGYGYDSAKIENCGSKAIIKGGYNFCGGIVGLTKGIVKNCYFAGKITVLSTTTSAAIASDDWEYGTLTNCYYIDSCGLTSERATSVTATQLASGEVTYLLNNKVTDGTQSWYQTIGTDTLPKFSGKTVYYGYNSTTSSMEYANKYMGDCQHNEYSNGICKVCGEVYEEPKLVDGVYQIANYGNLVWFQQYVDSGNYTANAILTNDIKANENLISNGTYVEKNVKYEWTPITKNSNEKTCYSGTFDGNGHTISGLYQNISSVYITSETMNIAFIGKFNGTIKNLYITDSYFGGNYNMGIFIGYGYDSSKIQNCGSNSVVKGSNYCGGIAGEAYGTIENCYFAGKMITGGSSSNSIADDRYGTLTNCYYIDSCGLTSERATSVTAAQLASGEVTYLLNNKVTDGTQVWYQTIGTDILPMFSGKTVYYNETASTPYHNATKGDVNNDGIVDKVDVALILKYISGAKTLSDEGIEAADYNGDSVVNIIDTTEMLKKIE